MFSSIRTRARGFRCYLDCNSWLICYSRVRSAVTECLSTVTTVIPTATPAPRLFCMPERLLHCHDCHRRAQAACYSLSLPSVTVTATVTVARLYLGTVTDTGHFPTVYACCAPSGWLCGLLCTLWIILWRGDTIVVSSQLILGAVSTVVSAPDRRRLRRWAASIRAASTSSSSTPRLPAPTPRASNRAQLSIRRAHSPGSACLFERPSSRCSEALSSNVHTRL